MGIQTYNFRVTGGEAYAARPHNIFYQAGEKNGT
jgi:hypothetical protein